MVALTENYLHKIINESIKKVLMEAGGTLTSKVIASQDAPRRSFNADEVLKRALSYNTLEEIYGDRNLAQMLRYHKMPDGRSYLDYVKEQFAKEGKYRTNKRGANRIKKINWTPESAIEYSSSYLNGYELAKTPEGRSCYYFLKTRNLLDRAFKKARAADAENAGIMLANRESVLQKNREEKAAINAQKRADAEARKKQRIIDKENERANKQLARDKKVQDIINFVKENGFKRRIDLNKANPKYYSILSNIPGMLESLFGDRENSRKIHDMDRLNASLAKSDSPSYFKRYSPLSYKRMMDNGTLQQHYPGWQQINGIWRKVGK